MANKTSKKTREEFHLWLHSTDWIARPDKYNNSDEYKEKKKDRYKDMKEINRNTPETQKCTSCGRELPADMFHRNNTKKSGLASKCKECMNKYWAERRQADRDARAKAKQKADAAKQGERSEQAKKEAVEEVKERIENMPEAVPPL